MSEKNKFNIQTFGSYKHLQGEFDDMKISFIDSNRMEANEESVYRKHTHIVYEAIIIEHGNYKCTVNDKMVKLSKWDIIVIQPGQKHEDFLAKGTIWYTFHFCITSDDKLNMLIFDKNIRPSEQIIHLASPERDFFSNMIKLFESESQENIYECYLIHNALFIAVFRKIMSLYSPFLLNEQFSSRHMVQQQAAKITSVFQKNLSKQPSLADLCKQCSMSRSSLHRTCQIYFNMPPRTAFLNYKMNHIVEFIKKNPDTSVKELSLIFGFKNQFHFSRMFKQQIGCYPSLLLLKYRKDHI